MLLLLGFWISGFLASWLFLYVSALNCNFAFFDCADDCQPISLFCEYPTLIIYYSIWIRNTVINVVFMDITSTKSLETTQNFMPPSTAHFVPTQLIKSDYNQDQLLVLQLCHTNSVIQIHAPVEAHVRHRFLREMVHTKQVWNLFKKNFQTQKNSFINSQPRQFCFLKIHIPKSIGSSTGLSQNKFFKGNCDIFFGPYLCIQLEGYFCNHKCFV